MPIHLHELDVVPELAERWEMYEGGERWVFHLRDPDGGFRLPRPYIHPKPQRSAASGRFGSPSWFGRGIGLLCRPPSTDSMYRRACRVLGVQRTYDGARRRGFRLGQACPVLAASFRGRQTAALTSPSLAGE